MYIQTKTPTDELIKCFYSVFNKLGHGFLEKVYERALSIELANHGFEVRCQVPINVFFEGELIGNFFADMLVNNEIILELKAVAAISDEHKAQLTNYLRATEIEVGYLFNFGRKLEFQRRVFSNQYKNLR
jgi:GxxExxY protein